jgi:hypothetical protein
MAFVISKHFLFKNEMTSIHIHTLKGGMDMSNTNFFSDKKKGKQAEAQFKQFFTNKQLPLQDLSEIKSWQLKGIDFKVGLKNDEEASVPVDVKKWNGKDTLYIETSGHNYPEQDGWLFKSQSQFIVWVSPEANQMLWVPLKAIRQWYEKNQDKVEIKLNKPSESFGKRFGQGAYFTVDRKEFEKISVIKPCTS